MIASIAAYYFQVCNIGSRFTINLKLPLDDIFNIHGVIDPWSVLQVLGEYNQFNFFGG